MALAGVVALLLLDECAAGAAGPAGFSPSSTRCRRQRMRRHGARALSAVAQWLRVDRVSAPLELESCWPVAALVHIALDARLGLRRSAGRSPQAALQPPGSARLPSRPIEGRSRPARPACCAPSPELPHRSSALAWGSRGIRAKAGWLPSHLVCTSEAGRAPPPLVRYPQPGSLRRALPSVLHDQHGRRIGLVVSHRIRISGIPGTADLWRNAGPRTAAQGVAPRVAFEDEGHTVLMTARDNTDFARRSA